MLACLHMTCVFVLVCCILGFPTMIYIPNVSVFMLAEQVQVMQGSENCERNKISKARRYAWYASSLLKLLYYSVALIYCYRAITICHINVFILYSVAHLAVPV